MKDNRTLSYPFIEGLARDDRDRYRGRMGRPFNTTAVADPIPTTSDELAEIVADDKRREAIFSDPERTKEFLGNWAKAANKGGDLSKQIAEQAAATVVEMLKEGGVEGRLPQDQIDEIKNEVVSLTNLNKPRSRSLAVYNPNAMGAKLDKEFANAAEYFKTIWYLNDQNPDVQEKRTKIRNAYSSSEPGKGGFLIPEVLRSQILSVSLETAIVRPRAFVVPMDSLRVPFPAIDSTSNVSSVHGGIVTYWTEEAGELTESEARFGRIVLEARKHTAYTEVPNELLQDSGVSFEAFIGEKFPEAMAHSEDYAFFQGTGVGEPLGFLNGASNIEVDKQSGQAGDTIVWENIVKVFSRMLPGSLGRAVWVASIDTFPELATMALSVGTGGSAIWLNNGAEGPPMTILGRPVLFTEKSPTLGNDGDLSFVDFGYYLVGDRQAMSAESSPHFKFKNDVTAFRIISRVDGRPWLTSAITPKNGGPTLSPFVEIAERA